MTISGIVLGRVVSCDGFEIDKTKVEVISKLVSAKTCQVLRHARLYRRFIKDFSTIFRLFYYLLLNAHHSSRLKIVRKPSKR